MGVRRDQPTRSVPGELRTADGKVVRVKLPPGLGREPSREATEARPGPPQAGDPRPAPLHNVPPHGAA